MNKNIFVVVGRAKARVRGRYARDVLAGWQRWSGADLKGLARVYGASYKRQRDKARAALAAEGGEVIAIDNGLLAAAVQVGVDDYGNAVYDTLYGPAVQHTARRARLL